MKKILTYFKPYKGRSLLGPLFKLLEATFSINLRMEYVTLELSIRQIEPAIMYQLFAYLLSQRIHGMPVL